MTTPLLLAAAILLCAYLVGSIPFGLLVGRLRGLDVRTVGSGNIGATNVARSLGKRLGALVLLLDAGKGMLVVAATRALEIDRIHPWLSAGAGLAVILGHCFPVWLRGRGGKGVATSLGVFAMFDPLVTGIGVLIFAGLYGLFHMASVGSISAALAFPLLLWALERPAPVQALGLAGATLILLKHRSNITRLLRREELKI
jgi:glycerol-3-phosphate acyltransferase PlsY